MKYLPGATGYGGPVVGEVFYFSNKPTAWMKLKDFVLVWFAKFTEWGK